MSGYVIVTPAHNEEALIEKTIGSILSQTRRPLRWVIVNDGSADRTGEIVAAYASEHPFIELINLERPRGRHFGHKAVAFNRGLACLRQTDYQYIGNLDADVSFEREYFKDLLDEFEKDPALGLAGGMVFSRIAGAFVSQGSALDSVAGAVQLFRRACFEQIGGYQKLPQGGIDAAAEITARMNGWRVRTFPGLRVLEHRRTGTAAVGPLAARLQEGRCSHSLGYGLLFYLLRCFYRVLEPPRVLGSAAGLMGYLTGLIRREPIVLPPEAVHYLRAEQRRKVLGLLRLTGRRQPQT